MRFHTQQRTLVPRKITMEDNILDDFLLSSDDEFADEEDEDTDIGEESETDDEELDEEDDDDELDEFSEDF